MSAPEKRIIAVVGGTGMFGGSVARSLHDNPAFHVRVTTRDPGSEKAQQISRLGIEVVRADSWSADELAAAFRGCWGLFLNTDSDDPSFKQQIGPPESDMGRIVVDAAVAQGVRHFVFSGLPEASKITGGAVPVLSFDNKAAIAAYARQAGFETAVSVNSGWALDIFWMETYAKAFGGFALIADADGFLTLKLPPMGNDPELVPWTSLEDDYGDAVHVVFLDAARWDGQTIWAVSECMSFEGVTDTYNRVVGRDYARYVVSDSALSAATEGKTKEVNGLVNYCHYVKGNYCGGKSLDQSPMKTLKSLASKARGRGESDSQLQTVEGFFLQKQPEEPEIQVSFFSWTDRSRKGISSSVKQESLENYLDLFTLQLV